MGKGPVGFAALLELMPRTFVKQAKAVEARARRRREAQAKRWKQEAPQVVEVKRSDSDDWPDTVADFNLK